MSKMTSIVLATVVTAVASIMLAPIAVIAYAVLFGHQFSSDQIFVASMMGVLGILPGITAGLMWGDL